MQTDAKGKGKVGEGSAKSEELADSIGNLSIGPGRTDFKKKPVIIIVIGMAGASNSSGLRFVETRIAWQFFWLFGDNVLPLVQGRGKQPLCTGWYAICSQPTREAMSSTLTLR